MCICCRPPCILGFISIYTTHTYDLHLIFKSKPTSTSEKKFTTAIVSRWRLRGGWERGIQTKSPNVGGIESGKIWSPVTNIEHSRVPNLPTRGPPQVREQHYDDGKVMRGASAYNDISHQQLTETISRHHHAATIMLQVQTCRSAFVDSNPLAAPSPL